MADVIDKSGTEQTVTASGRIKLSTDTVDRVMAGKMPHSDVIATARLAGIMAAKRTSDLIPLHYPLALTSIEVEIAPLETHDGFAIEATAKVKGSTGVEMEALTAVTVAALTLYNMVKGVDHAVVIGEIKLIAGSLDRSGDDDHDERGTSPGAHGEKPSLVSRGFRRTPGAVARARAIDPTTSAGPNAVSRLENCRQFMRDNKLQVTAWASLAGLPPGLVYGFLHGRVGRLPKDSEERLAKAANATVRDVFGPD